MTTPRRASSVIKRSGAELSDKSSDSVIAPDSELGLQRSRHRVEAVLAAGDEYEVEAVPRQLARKLLTNSCGSALLQVLSWPCARKL